MLFHPNLAATWDFKQSGNSNEVYFEETSIILFHYALETMHAWSVKEHDRLNGVLGTKQN